MRIRILLSACLLPAITAPPAHSFQSVSNSSEKVRMLAAEADSFATILFRNEDALRVYEEALALDEKDYDVLIGISRAYVDIGEHLPGRTDGEKERQLRHYERALEFAERALTVRPEASMGLTRRAIANGRIALFRGVWESLDLVEKVREDTERAIAIDPSNATAHYILGRTHAKVSEKPGIVRWPLGLGWASLDDAVQNFEKAIALRPDFIMYRLDAARAYVVLDEEDLARMHLNAIPSISNADEDDEQYRKEAAKLLEDLRM